MLNCTPVTRRSTVRGYCRSSASPHPSSVNNSHEKTLATSENNFGELLRATGPMAKANPIRWSTKYTDDETDLVMYPYRPYSPSLGIWLSRDPIEERGGQNLYGFCRNNGVNTFDPDGRNPAVIVIGGVTVTVGECAIIAVTVCMAIPSCRDALIDLIRTGVTELGDCCRPKPKKCLPCSPAVGSIAYRVDMPPSPAHNGIPTPHSHQFQMNQSPPAAGCRCFWVETLKDPLPGILGPPITPAAGGGIAP